MGKKGTVFLSEALTDEYIMLEEQDDDLEAIVLNGITLAYYDRKPECAPDRLKVLRMFPV
ncbi:hypothetical protein U3C44_22900 (plasmid) [Enterobacter asburiae]|uniref:hypothetical protein n=1 Tax=Enterobacter asburiae TaxID=61645 RepID=UPI002933D806|nr:hypothetical protein [Enterobacter asburiae]EMA4739790.1 hypothetical protein [Enterobacter asburiae]